MICSNWTLALPFLLLFATTARAQEQRPWDPRIRSEHAELVDALVSGARTSETLRHLIAHIEASDVIVYLVIHRSSSPTVTAHVSFISTAGGRRYLYVAVDPRYTGCQLISLLGHELQHVVEIADEPSVIDVRSLAAFYRRIGFNAAGWEADRFDSQKAIEAGQRVMREMLTPGFAASRAQ